MLLEFTVENYRSYRGPAKLSMVASPAKELPENLIHVQRRDLSLIRSAVIYGANGSGKSNLLSAMDDLSELVEAPTKFSLFHRLSCEPFGLDETSAGEPSRLGATFLVDDILYEYNVALKRAEVVEEKLVAYPNNRPNVWFHRVRSKIKLERSPSPVLQELSKAPPSDRLFLGLAAALGVPKLAVPARWLASSLRNRLEFGAAFSVAESRTIQKLGMDERFKTWATSLLRHADIGIKDIEIEERKNPASYQSEDGDYTVDFLHFFIPGITQRDSSGSGDPKRYHPVFLHESEAGSPRRFLLADESHGTRRLFGMLAPFYDVLSKGELAVIDEFSASLHPVITRELVRLFHRPDINTKGAQLVFTTHDTNLLSGRLFRRDQVWFAEKDRSGATDLYSLHDVKGVREDDALEKGYLRGRYGAIPFIGEFDFPPLAEDANAK